MQDKAASLHSRRVETTREFERRYARVRSATESLAGPLSTEDCAAQSMPDASPVKWHLAHTTWFFETFVLARRQDFTAFDERYLRLFNSYYNAIGDQFPRPARGLLTRPSLETILRYRKFVDEIVMARLADGTFDLDELELIELGLNHEQQHQELILTDVKHLLSASPLSPKYRDRWPLYGVSLGTAEWIAFEGGPYEIGAAGDGFSFDNESPRHTVWLNDFEIASSPVTNAQYLEFIEDGGYERPELWLDAGWAAVRENGWNAPLYWRQTGDGWRIFTLHGEVAIDPHAPACHLSFYESEAFSRWSGARLPTEAEWEIAARRQPVEGNFLESGALHPLAPRSPKRPGELAQLYGDVWEWTRSDYGPYPGFLTGPGAVGEYNGKFMSGQHVLRGGSCATPSDHIRATYRNFFPPKARWQFTGVRLARDKRPRRAAGRREVAARTEFILAGGSAEAPNRDADELARCLSGAAPKIPPKYFYDTIGSQLFETITRLPEYYIPDAEAEILEQHGDEIFAAVREALGCDFQMVDLGAGNCEKAEKLLPALAPSRYIAIDISASFLKNAVDRLQARFPDIPMAAVAMDFSAKLEIPARLSDRPTLVFYPGSSLGNFDVPAARRLLAAARTAAPASAILVGVDLVKDEHTLIEAYDDATGVTAAFNRNVLMRVNRILGANFDPALWRHVAQYNAQESRIEMHLEAKTSQVVRWRAGERSFAAGARILTEHSRKWRPEDIRADLNKAGFASTSIWTDANARFAVALGAP